MRFPSTNGIFNIKSPWMHRMELDKIRKRAKFYYDHERANVFPIEEIVVNKSYYSCVLVIKAGGKQYTVKLKHDRYNNSYEPVLKSHGLYKTMQYFLKDFQAALDKNNKALQKQSLILKKRQVDQQRLQELADQLNTQYPEEMV